MYDPAGPQLPQEVKKVNYDKTNTDIKLKSEVIVKNNQVSLQDSVQAQVHKIAGTIEKEPKITSTSGISNNDVSTEEEVDLMNFDDDCLDFDFKNKEMAYGVQRVSMIDQLLCDLDFGKEPLTTKDEPKSKMKQNEQTTQKHPEQEILKKKILIKDNDGMRAQNKTMDVFTYQISPVSSSYVEPENGTNPIATTRTMNEAQKVVNGTQPTVASHTYVTNMTQTAQTAGPSRIKLVNGIQPTITPRTHIMNEVQTDVTFPTTEMTRQKHKSMRKIYSFVELLIYQFSPITKELHNNVNKRFSHHVVDYDLLKDNPQMTNDQPRRPGVLRGTVYQYQQRNGWNNKSLDAWDRSMDHKNDRFVTSPIRKHFENPLELSFLKECVIAQNRWTALMHEREQRELRTSCTKEIKNCKGMKWVNAHMSLADKHSESCLALHVINDICSEEKDNHHNF